MAAAAILKSVKRHNSAIFGRIWTKFDTDTENKVAGQLLPSELVSDKIQDGGGLKMGSRSEIYRQNSQSAKIQDGGGRHFEIS